jgi:hypothetical protein
MIRENGMWSLMVDVRRAPFQDQCRGIGMTVVALAWIIHEYGEIWVEQGFSPAFTARLGLAAFSR